MSVLGVYGSGGLGRELVELARIINKKQKLWEELIFIDDGDAPSVVDGCTVYKYDVAKEKYGALLQAAIGVGEPAVRAKLLEKLKNDGIHMPALIHPDVHIPETAVIGEGVVIQEGCFISVGVTIGDYALLQAKCAIGHDSVLGEGCIISTFDSIAGAVKIGRFTYIGMSVAIKELASVGDWSVVGMGSMVMRDIPDEVIAMGNPARPMKKNEEHRVFKH